MLGRYRAKNLDNNIINNNFVFTLFKQALILYITMKILMILRISCIVLLLDILFISCSPTKLIVSDVSYQSIKNERTDILDNVPSNAKILVTHKISPDGELTVFVKNLTDEIMTIDRTKSFFINTNGRSITFYDSDIQSSTVTNYTASTNSVSTSLSNTGALSNVLGAISAGTSSTTGQSTSNTSYNIDQPVISIAPMGEINMGRVFSIGLVGSYFLKDLSKSVAKKDDFELVANSYEESTSKFSIAISYSLDEGKTYNRITSKYYTDYLSMSFVKTHGKTNESLRNIYIKKPDALIQPWYIINFNTNIHTSNTSKNIYSGTNLLYDYQ